jgi:citrate lyase subunit beta/citryl-CoA lyase
MTSTSTANLPLTYLFVPGNRADRYDKALGTSAGAIIIDFEDAVSPADKDAARTAFAAWHRASTFAPERILVRVNAEDTPWFDEDLAVIADTGVRGIMLPKTETVTQIARAASALPANGFVIALVETAKGVIGVDEVASAPRLQRMAFGTLDYALELDLSGDERGFLYPACRIALASRAAGMASPIAGVTPEIGDEQSLLADLNFARACGFGAKLCIHPKQVEAIHAAMRPSEAEIAWAKRVALAAETGSGAIQVDGKMVDRPVIVKAQRILART